MKQEHLDLIAQITKPGFYPNQVCSNDTQREEFLLKLSDLGCRVGCLGAFIQCLRDNPGGWGGIACNLLLDDCMNNCVVS